MKAIISMAVVMALAGFRCVAQTPMSTGDENPASMSPGYTITITQPTSPLSLVSPIKVKMTITNMTDRNVFWRAVWSTDKDSWYRGFRFLLTKNGKEVKTTFFHREISGRQQSDDPSEVWAGSTVLLPKPPGVMFVITVDLKRLYEITEPSQYTLEISRIGENYRTVVRSNTVTLNILP